LGTTRYLRARWPTLLRYRDDGQLEIDNNAAEHAVRDVALGHETGCSPAPTTAANARRSQRERAYR
jgi:hypothetical protein